MESFNQKPSNATRTPILNGYGYAVMILISVLALVPACSDEATHVGLYPRPPCNSCTIALDPQSLGVGSGQARVWCEGQAEAAEALRACAAPLEACSYLGDEIPSPSLDERASCEAASSVPCRDAWDACWAEYETP